MSVYAELISHGMPEGLDSKAQQVWLNRHLKRLADRESCLNAEQLRTKDDLRNACAHLIVEAGIVPGITPSTCRCEECRLVAKSMDEAGYLDGITDRWWEAAEAAGGE